MELQKDRYGSIQKHPSVFSSTIVFTAASMLARLAGFIVQIVLGWVLVKEQYGLFAIALSIAAVFSCMRNGGTDQIIIQKGKEYNQLAPRIASFSLIFNLLVCLLFISLSSEISKYYDESQLNTLLIILAIGYLFATPGPILTAKLSIKKEFHKIAIANFVTIISKHLLTVVFAFIGFGVYSLLIPLALQPLISACIVFSYVKSWPGFSELKQIKILQILKSSIWVILSNFAFQLSNNIQYFVLAGYFSSSVIGVYFFAAQIINSPIALINNTVKGVIFPTLSNINDNRESYIRAAKKSLYISYTIGAIIAIIGIYIFPFITNIVWKGKWNESIVFIELLCLFIPLNISINTLYELLASSGLWRERFILLVLSTIVDVTAIFLVINQLDVLVVVTSLLISKVIFCFFACNFSIIRICGKIEGVDVILLFVPFTISSIVLVHNELLKVFQITSLELTVIFSLSLIYYFLLFHRYMNINKIILKIFRR